MLIWFHYTIDYSFSPPLSLSHLQPPSKGVKCQVETAGYKHPSLVGWYGGSPYTRSIGDITDIPD